MLLKYFWVWTTCTQMELYTGNNVYVVLLFIIIKNNFIRIDSYMYYFFQFQCGLISEDEKYPFPPRFTRFLVISGPRTHQYYFSSLPREVMMGPRTGNDQKTGKTKAEMGIFHPQKSILTQIERK